MEAFAQTFCAADLRDAKLKEVANQSNKLAESGTNLTEHSGELKDRMRRKKFLGVF